ncbi:hypothetical protein PM082_023518 [Marasmius tenuissimus]|nr:hypothetical protein PM082_023518 [Marasmius tenuissimus]
MNLLTIQKREAKVSIIRSLTWPGLDNNSRCKGNLDMEERGTKCRYWSSQVFTPSREQKNFSTQSMIV